MPWETVVCKRRELYEEVWKNRGAFLVAQDATRLELPEVIFLPK